MYSVLSQASFWYVHEEVIDFVSVEQLPDNIINKYWYFVVDLEALLSLFKEELGCIFTVNIIIMTFHLRTNEYTDRTVRLHI